MCLEVTKKIMNTFCFMRYPHAFHLFVLVYTVQVDQITYTQNDTQILKITHPCTRNNVHTNTRSC